MSYEYEIAIRLDDERRNAKVDGYKHPGFASFFLYPQRTLYISHANIMGPKNKSSFSPLFLQGLAYNHIALLARKSGSLDVQYTS